MREFEFRGKCISQKPEDKSIYLKWIYGDLHRIGNKYFIYCIDGFWREVDKETVGQFTGLRDNKKTEEYPKGQKIYEGDLFYYHDVLRKVVYREDNTSWMGIVVRRQVGSCNFYLRDITDNYDIRLYAEIIGDIY